MTPGNMAIVLGPNLLWTHNEPYVFLKQLIILFFGFKPVTLVDSAIAHLSALSRNMTEMMTTVSLQIVGIIEPIIQHADWFFPGGGDYTICM